MPIKTRLNLKAAVDVAFADNTTGAITAESLRTQLADLADSAAFPGDIDAAILAIPPKVSSVATDIPGAIAIANLLIIPDSAYAALTPGQKAASTFLTFVEA